MYELGSANKFIPQKSSSCVTHDKSWTQDTTGPCRPGHMAAAVKGDASHREAHVCELFDQPGHDPGLVLLARCFHALEPRVGGESP